MDWNTNVISTMVPGTRTAIGDDLVASGGDTITLAFATGECGSESFGGVPGPAMAAANVPLLEAAGVDFIVSTGGAAGSFTCGSDAGFETFLGRWASDHLVGVDLDIEAGQSAQQIADLIARIAAAHDTHPTLRFSLTIATLANTDGAPSLNVHGTDTLQAMRATFGDTWPAFVTVDLMTMDYGGPSPGVCVVVDGACQMGQSAVQAAHNLNATFGVPYEAIELTPMIGGNDVQGELFTLDDVDTVMAFAIDQGLAGVHWWSYDRDVDCDQGFASPTCNSIGGAGPRGYLNRFLAAAGR
ncbi:MAG: glycosyl hydrolase [Kofleriaceae bacterium]|nr:glycosyl hydrolase [Kofleriaceae bacterium]